MLDALHVGALPADQTAPLRQHISGCGLCTARMAEIERGFDAFAQLDERRVLARVRQTASTPRPWWVRWLPLVAIGAAAAIALLVVPPRPAVRPASPSTGVRMKGKAQLQVFRQTEQGSEAVQSGATLSSGSRFKFGIDVPAAGAVRILGLDAKGAYTIWEGSLPKGQSIIPGAHTLDDAPGPERLFGVHCPDQKSVPACPLVDQRPHCPSPCTVSSFIIRRPR
jgi:hypothetical protein